MKKEAGEASVKLGHHSHALNDGTKELGRFTRGAAAGSGVLSHFGRSVAFASTAFLGAAGFTAVLKQSIGAASDLHEQINKTDVVFGKSAGVVKQWSKDSATAMGIARNEALGMAATFGNLLHPMGIARDEAARMSTRMVQLASDMASFNNADPSEVLKALQSGLAGQVRPLRQFGVFLDQARIKAVALADGIVKPTVESRKLSEAQAAFAIAQDKVTQAIAKHGPKSREAAAAQLTLAKAADAVSKAMAGHVPALTAAQKALATYQIVLKDTKDAQGDFHRTSGGLANQTRILKAELTNLEEELGTALLPTINKYLPHVTRWLALNEKNGTFQRDFNKAVKIGGEVVDGVIPVIKNIVALFQGFSKAVGGSKNAIEILGATFVGVKFGGAIIKATEYVKELRIALLALGDAEVMGVLGPLGVAAAAIIGTGAVIGIAAGSQVPGTSGSMKVPGSRVAAQRKAHPKAPIATSVDWDTKGNYQITWQDPQTGATRVQNATPEQAAKVLGISVAALNKRSGLGPHTDTGFRSANIPEGTPSQIAVSAAKSPGAGSTSFHLQNERQPYDCSAFTQAVFRKAGIPIGSNTYAQIAKGRKVDVGDLQADDLVFFNYGNEKWPGHVAIYVGGGMVVHDHGSKGGVSYTSLSSLAAGSNHRPEGRCYIASHNHTAAAGTGAGAGAGTGGVGAATTFHEKPKPPPKPHVVTGTALLTADTRVALAQADTPVERRAALVTAAKELGQLQRAYEQAHRGMKSVPIAEELGRINKQIQAIDVAAVRKKHEAIAKSAANMTARVKEAIANQKTAWEKHVQDLQQIAADAKTKFEDQWSKMADRTMSAFDDATGKGLSKMQKAYAETVKSFDKDTAAHLKQMAKDAAAALDAFDAETAAGLAARAAPDQTPTEKLLAEREAARHAGDVVKRVADARKALEDARAAAAGPSRTVTADVSAGTTTWTPPLDPNTTPEQAAASMQQLQDAVVAAQKDLDDALYDQQTDALQAQADAERKAADAQAADAQSAYQKQREQDRANLAQSLQDAQDGYQAERDNLAAHNDEMEQTLEDGYSALREQQRQNLQDWLDYQEGQLEAGKTQWSDFFTQLVALAGSYGMDAGAAWQAAWIQAGGAAGGVAGAAAAAAAAKSAGPAAGAAGFGGFDANGNWVGGTIDSNPGFYGFATGGVVGQPRPRTIDPRDTIWVRARAGETIRTPEQEAALQASYGGDIHVHIHGPVFDSRRALEDAVASLAQPGISRRSPSIPMGR